MKKYSPLYELFYGISVTIINSKINNKLYHVKNHHDIRFSNTKNSGNIGRLF